MTRTMAARVVLLATLLTWSGALRAAPEHYVRFLYPERTYLKLAWARAGIVQRSKVRLRFGVGGRGVVAAEVICGDQRQLLGTRPGKGYQKLAVNLQVEVGANLVEVYTYRQNGRVDRHAMWIVRVPPRGDPPTIAWFENYRLQGTEFVRGLVLGHGLQALAVQTDGMDEAVVLDGKLDPRKTSHEFVTQIELKPEEQRVCFVARTRKGLRGLRCLERTAPTTPRTRALIVVPQIDRSDSRTAASYFGSDAEALVEALSGRASAADDVVLLTGRAATAGTVLENWQQLLGRSAAGDALVLAYLGGLDEGGLFSLAPSPRSPERSLRLSVQSLVDLSDRRAPGEPQVLVLQDLIDAEGRGAEIPSLTARRPVCAITAAAPGQPSIRSSQLGGSLFSSQLKAGLTVTDSAEPVSARALFDALEDQARQQSEGAQQPQLHCSGKARPESLRIPASAPAPSSETPRAEDAR